MLELQIQDLAPDADPRVIEQQSLARFNASWLRSGAIARSGFQCVRTSWADHMAQGRSFL